MSTLDRAAETSGRTVAVIGASADRGKFGNKAVRAYQRQGWRVYPIHPHAEQIEGIPAYRSIAEVPGPIDRVTMYVPPEVGITLLEAIAAKKPREFFVNPGAESEALLQRARQLGLVPIVACSILEVGVQPEELGE